MPVRPPRLPLLFLVAALALGGCDAADLGTMLGIGDGNPPVSEAPPPPRPKPTPKPIPTPKPAPSNMGQQLVRNLAFDKVRGRGIREVYEGQTKLARETFRAAREMKPADRSVGLWLGAIEEAYSMKRRAKTTGPGAAGAPGMPAGGGLEPPPAAPVAPLPGKPQGVPSFDPLLVF
ncbi:MAG: hypothetical protein VKQ33_13990 [Candidatus Sericytochromatia bacterium]|nr:hypothetical protein [Candidatus Sericytochromatia bacterium]